MNWSFGQTRLNIDPPAIEAHKAASVSLAIPTHATEDPMQGGRLDITAAGWTQHFQRRVLVIRSTPVSKMGQSIMIDHELAMNFDSLVYSTAFLPSILPHPGLNAKLTFD